MGFFSRILRFFRSEANSALDRFEDPVKMTEQGIRDLRKDLQDSMKALAETKAVYIRLQRDGEERKKLAQEYESKAILLLKKAEQGDLAQSEADRLAGEALAKKDFVVAQATRLLHNSGEQEVMIKKMEANVKKLKEQISSWESELVTLKSRSKVATATKKLNQQMAQIDSNGTIAMLEKMRSKVVEEEALSESYAQIGALEGNVDDEINRALQGKTGNGPLLSSSLDELKAKLKSGAT